MTSTPSVRRALLVPLALLALLATAGCVNLPANTTASVVGNPAKGGSGADVRIWPQAPQRGSNHPEQVVEGFLQTAASDPSNYTIARLYLAGEALNNWDSNRIAVFSDVSSPVPTSTATTSGHVQVQISGTMVATVSDDGAYQQIEDPAKEATYTFDLSYNQAKGYFQIDQLPRGPYGEFGILLTQDVFRADFAAYDLYYLNQDAPTSSMIPVPDYQRSQLGDAATAQNLVTALLSGPPDALTGAAARAVPNFQLAAGQQVTISSDDTASVPIKSPANCATQGRRGCELLADELLATFSSLASVSRVTLVDPQGNPLVTSSSVSSLASQYHIAATPGKPASFYYLDSKTHQVNRYENGSAGSNTTVVEPLGPSSNKYSQLAVGSYQGQTYAAVVDDKGSKLYVGTTGAPKNLTTVFAGQHIGSMSWDALGHLWFLAFAGNTASLYQWDVTRATPALQQVILAGDGGNISEIAAAPDGRRIAVSYSVPGPTPGSEVDSVGIAVVEHNESGLELNLSYGLDQPVVYHWTAVSDVCWHGSQVLAVLGSQSPSSQQTVSELNSDGSPVISAADLTPITVNPPTGTESIEWTGGALLAATHSGSGASAGQQVQQYSFTTSTWTVAADGSSPTYAMNQL